MSLNAPTREEGDSGEWQDRLVDEISDQETRLAESEESDNRRKALGKALSVLNDRERRIFEARRLADDPITLNDLASEFAVSRERVRQIEVRAFEKVQNAVKNRVAAVETSAPLRIIVVIATPVLRRMSRLWSGSTPRAAIRTSDRTRRRRTAAATLRAPRRAWIGRDPSSASASVDRTVSVSLIEASRAPQSYRR